MSWLFQCDYIIESFAVHYVASFSLEKQACSSEVFVTGSQEPMCYPQMPKGASCLLAAEPFLVLMSLRYVESHLFLVRLLSNFLFWINKQDPRTINISIGEFPLQRPVTLSFDVSVDLCLNKRLNEQSRRQWFETPLCSLWRHCNV